ncbi:hypothetical protein F2Q69_00002176 [Brassica cretica]|uniref:Uncharacterized protein n=1 Tax=Brassica cretica TaxID=69181 RepID=A0A8S9NZ04_BRACR|nr:hypothetical protein F2Q69_00002176 [Brassica cretica]
MGNRHSDIAALNAASAAVAVSSIAWRGPFGAVRVGMSLGRRLIVDPSPFELCHYFLTYVATRKEELIVEFQSNHELTLDEKMGCITLAKSQVFNLLEAQDRLRYKEAQIVASESKGK